MEKEVNPFFVEKPAFLQAFFFILFTKSEFKKPVLKVD